MFDPVIEIYEIMDYVGNVNTPDPMRCKRPFVEGSAILKAKHLMECGIIKREESYLKVLALCLQTSNLDGKPHQVEVKIWLEASPNGRQIKGMCSCKAGSGKCKHVIAVMLFLNRKSTDDLEDLSCTETEQQWGKIRSSAKIMYSAVPVSQFCCAQPKQTTYKGRHKPRERTPALENAVRGLLLEGSPDSALAIMLDNRRFQMSEFRKIVAEEGNDERQEEIRALVTNLIISSNEVLIESSSADKIMLYQCTAEEQTFYSEQVHVSANQAVYICLETCNQVGDVWIGHRRYRITGSKCYGLYTYNKETKNVVRNWEAKLESTIFPTFTGNADTTYGRTNEPKAIEAYQQQTNHEVTHLGLIINHHASWLGYSPDGVVASLERLVEVKCLKAGRTVGGMDMVRETKCLLVKDGIVTLKKRHAYYGQIQLGMLLTGLNICDFVLYSKAFNEVVIVEVPFDKDFTKDMIHHLRQVYFGRLLPYICRRHKGINTN